MTAIHPTERQLVAWLDATESARRPMLVSRHLEECSVCRALVHDALGPIDRPIAATNNPVSILTPRLETRFNEPSRGQVWRVRWEDLSHVALVWSTDVDWLSMIPITADVGYADDSTVLIANGSHTGALALWLGLETALPFHVLDIQLMDLPPNDLDATRSLVRAGKSIDIVGLDIGDPIFSALDDRFEYRAQLGGDFSQLAETHWAPKGTGLLSLSDLAAAAGVELGIVAEALGVPSTERLRLRRGQRPITDEEAKRIAPLFDVPTETVLATNPPIEQNLVLALSRPRWRGFVSDKARRASITETEELRHDAYAVAGLAARESAVPATEADWHERLRHYFAS